MTPLMYAVLGNHLEAITVLLECGADINAKDCHGYTPLHCVPEHGCVDLLLQEGADLQARTLEGETPEDIWNQKYEHMIADEMYFNYEDDVDLYEMIFCGLSYDLDSDARLPDIDPEYETLIKK